MSSRRPPSRSSSGTTPEHSSVTTRTGSLPCLCAHSAHAIPSPLSLLAITGILTVGVVLPLTQIQGLFRLPGEHLTLDIHDYGHELDHRFAEGVRQVGEHREVAQQQADPSRSQRSSMITQPDSFLNARSTLAAITMSPFSKR